MKTTLIAAIFLEAIALLHLLRLLFGWSVIVGTTAIPMWPSFLVVPIFGWIAIQLLRNRKKQAPLQP